MKKCIKCNIDKEISLFVKGKNSCKDCEKEYKRQYALKNKEVLKAKSKIYYENNKEYVKTKSKIYYEENKDKKIEYQKIYSLENKEKIKEYKSEYSYLNRDKLREYKNNYQNRRRKEEPIFKLKYVISRTIRRSLKCKGISKSKKSIEILGCTIEFFKRYIEEMFIGDMSWENYGTYWDLDHKIPLSTAETEEDVLRLNHYTNLQPLDSYINRNIKRDKLDFYENF